MRLPLLTTLIISIIGVVIGSFFDLQISTAIASSTNSFGMFFTMAAPLVGFAGLSIMSGGFLALAIKGKYKIWAKIIFVILALVIFGEGIYFASPEIYGVNGLNNSSLIWLAYLISALCMSGGTIGGYFIFRNNNNPYLWVAFTIGLLVTGIALGVGVNVLKNVLHRPRYRVVSITDIPFYSWWNPCKEYHTYMEQYSVSKEEFKSFPSGHTAYATLLLIPICIMPFGNSKTNKLQIPLFAVAAAFIIVVGLARILVGAHYLSDVSFGAAMTTISLFAANEILVHIKAVNN